MAASDPDIRRRIEALHVRYVRTIDDDRIEDWPSLFTVDGLYRIITRENHEQNLPLAIMECQGRNMMHDRVTGLRRINVYEPHRYSHQASGLWIDTVEGNRIQCRSNFLVIRTMAAGAMTIFAAGVYLDTIDLDGEDALFEERTVITDSRQVDTLLVIPL